MAADGREEVRRPAVAGSFYPLSADDLYRRIDAWCVQSGDRVRAKGVVAPHAGVAYSGPVAGAVYGRIEPPDTAVLIGPDHYLEGGGVSVMARGRWEIPGGEAWVDEALAGRVLKALESPARAGGGLEVVVGGRAHEREHALEVQLPFLVRIRGRGDEPLRIVPILMRADRPESCRALGRALAEALADRPGTWVLVASTDFNHEEPHDVALRKDAAAIDAILRLEPEAFLEVVARRDVRMCGHGPVAAVMTACRALGAERAELVRHMTSGEVNGDFGRVVGYAGILIH
ncbi:MAG: AmmeMemoRadiSam system protein B [Nitrospinota bacterium]